MPQNQTNKEISPLEFGNMAWKPNPDMALKISGGNQQQIKPTYKHAFSWPEVLAADGPVKYFGPDQALALGLTDEEIEKINAFESSKEKPQ